MPAENYDQASTSCVGAAPHKTPTAPINALLLEQEFLAKYKISSYACARRFMASVMLCMALFSTAAHAERTYSLAHPIMFVPQNSAVPAESNLSEWLND